MTEEDARLALLQAELSDIQSGIRGLDTILFQIKGWCVTASLAIGGFAASNHQPELLIIGAGAVAGFYLVQCQFKLIQRAFIRRNREIDSELKRTGIMQFLKGAGTFEVFGTIPLDLYPTGSPTSSSSLFEQIRDNLPAFWMEARLPSSFSLYLFILACLAVEGIVLA
jgi:hypothetical protein